MILELVVGVFGFILTMLGTLLLSYFKSMREDINKMSESICDMNTKLATVINDQTWHKEELQELKDRVHKLEH